MCASSALFFASKLYYICSHEEAVAEYFVCTAEASRRWWSTSRNILALNGVFIFSKLLLLAVFSQFQQNEIPKKVAEQKKEQNIRVCVNAIDGHSTCESRGGS